MTDWHNRPMADDGRPIPRRDEIFAARGLIEASRVLGRRIPPEIIRDANWPLEDAAPYPEDRTAS